MLAAGGWRLAAGGWQLAGAHAWLLAPRSVSTTVEPMIVMRSGFFRPSATDTAVLNRLTRAKQRRRERQCC